MYESYWGLNESPFRGALDPRFYFNSPVHEEALARMNFLIDNRRRVGLMMSRSGSGKSLLLEVLASQLRRAGHSVAQLRCLGIDHYEFVWRLAVDLGQNVDPRWSIGCHWRAVGDVLQVNRYQRTNTVVMIDDADEAESEVLSTIVRLAQQSPAPDSRLTILLTCNEERVELLGRRLLDLCELRIELRSWQHQDTAEYLRSTLAKAGREKPAFDVFAIARLHDLADGVPRKVRQIAELSLVAGAGQEQDLIDADTVEAVYEELSITAGAQL
ncbi:MAG: hypothetical protein R3E01_12115 [Pirellulaceae bacterium]|nr:hypothetical protein [Planctomycetales bacterium]